MKKGPNKQTLNNYLSCFTDIKNGLSENPRVKLTDYATRYKIGKQPITVLKNTGVIIRHGNGFKWVGPEPSYQLIINVLEIIRRYHYDLKKRKSDQGELFKPKEKKKHYKGKETPTFYNIEVEKQQLENWQRNYERQQPEITNIPIQTFDRSTASEFVETEKLIQTLQPEINPGNNLQKELNRAIINKILTSGVKFIINLFKRKK
ncbi:hypothetical protein UFOVP611_33 [uncultured Caudovirales phage]|uniref:Uncharacterized protein n=1 Tax=uncultured Caudovirales phage TaxID=2100421 RepID=A0A6J5N6P6_9CAUD|nr:hypothetical protein UFOVP611_33 [uncultured Caudovirales phage]